MTTAPFTNSSSEIPAAVHAWIATQEDAALAILTIGREYNVAVAYEPLQTFQLWARRQLTPAEVDRLTDPMSEYDEWLSTSGGYESVCEWRDQTAAKAGIVAECTSCGKPAFTGDDGATRHAVEWSPGEPGSEHPVVDQVADLDHPVSVV